MSIHSFDDVRLSLRCRPINKLQVRRTSLPYSEFFTPKFKRGKKGGGIRSGSDIFMVLEAENEKFYNGEDYYKGY